MEPNTISYSEERTVNIGDYEARKMWLSVSTKVVDINLIDKKVVIANQETIKCYDNLSIADAIDRAVTTVRTRLDADEKKLRTQAQEFLSDILIEKGRKMFGIEVEETDITDFEEEKPKRKAKKFKGEDEDDDFGDDADEFEEENLRKAKRIIKKKSK